MSIQNVFDKGGVRTWASGSGVTYLGPSSTTGLVLKNKEHLQVDEFGAATLKREWWLRRSATITDYLPKRGDRDDVYSGLEVFDFDVSGEGAAYHITVMFNGFLEKPQSPQYHETIASAVREQIIYSTTPVVGRVGSLNFRFLAPVRTRRWVSDREPKFTPANRYIVTDFEEPIAVIGVFSDDIQLTGDPLDDYLEFFDLRSLETSVRTNLEIDKVGAVYRINETVERIYIQEQEIRYRLKQSA